MRMFETVLEVESRYQSGPRVGEAFLSKTEVHCIATNEVEAKKLIDENFRHRMPAGAWYELRDIGEAPPGAAVGFTMVPIS